MNPKTQAIIDAAKERTRRMLEHGNQSNQTATLPSSLGIAQKQESANLSNAEEATEVRSTIITIGSNTFDPFEIPNVGRANKEQAAAITLFGLKGESGCLIGPAGTGKTTTMQAVIRAAILSGRIPIMSDNMVHKYLKAGSLGIYGGSFTRIATRNLRNNFPADLQCNVHTIHRLLEFEPEIIDVTDPTTGMDKKIRVFKPTRHSFRSLDANLVTFFLDEGSMIGVDLHTKFRAAIHPSVKPQIVYIGDIAQLPPVMDDAILGYKMIEFLKENKLVELTQVYRHAGAIVNLANHIRVGNTIPDVRITLPYLGNLRKLPRDLVEKALLDWNKEEDGSKVTIHLWKRRLDGEVGQLQALQNLGLGFFPKEIAEGKYNPKTDMILMPYNKAVGTIELNKYISGFISRANEQEVYEIIAGYQKHYMAVGDKVFHEREEAEIVKISINGMYAGRSPQASSITLDRWGHNTAGTSTKLAQDDGAIFDDVEALLNIDIGDDDEERKNQASHVVTVRKLNDENAEESSLQTASDINGLLFGYALTIHKSQGSQWPKVYCVFHNSHNRNLQRELLYTAITRAQKELYVIAEPETFIQGVTSQHIIGNTLEQKAEYFKGKIEGRDKRDGLFKE